MKLSWKLLCSLAVGAMLAGTAHAANQPCTAGCGTQKVACLMGARVTKLACKQNCRATSAPTALGSCSRGCTSTARSAKTTCNSDHSSCIGACTPSKPCPATCGMSLATCAQGVAATAQSCVRGCATASDRASCVMGCATATENGQASCQANFQTCIAGCPSSPSGAFLDAELF